MCTKNKMKGDYHLAYYITSFFYSYTILSKDSFCSLPSTNQSQCSISQTPNRNFRNFQHFAKTRSQLSFRLKAKTPFSSHITALIWPPSGTWFMETIGHAPHKPATKSLVWVVFGSQSQPSILEPGNLNFRNFVPFYEG
jgi:hypothetical protein